VRWLVDGMNVIGSKPDGWWRDREGAMRRLAAQLGAYAAETGDSVTVVFDGEPFELKVPVELGVAFAPGGPNAADDEIVARLEAEPDPSRVTVITSDGALSERARALGADVIGAGGFRRELRRRAHGD
jgi:predicted RNA-binding protein with PIN domain